MRAGCATGDCAIKTLSQPRARGQSRSHLHRHDTLQRLQRIGVRHEGPAHQEQVGRVEIRQRILKLYGEHHVEELTTTKGPRSVSVIQSLSSTNLVMGTSPIFREEQVSSLQIAVRRNHYQCPLVQIAVAVRLSQFHRPRSSTNQSEHKHHSLEFRQVFYQPLDPSRIRPLALFGLQVERDVLRHEEIRHVGPRVVRQQNVSAQIPGRRHTRRQVEVQYHDGTVDQTLSGYAGRDPHNLHKL